MPHTEQHTAPSSLMPVHFEVGDEVVVTPQHLATMKSSNRSCVTAGYPSDSFLVKIEGCVGVVGQVTHTFRPGYDVTVRFGEQSFHMKSGWFGRAQ